MSAETADERPVVLVGEDSMVVREVLRWHLEADGFEIYDTGDGAEAIALAVRLRPSVILLGIELASTDGYGALAAIKANPELADTPVVFITGHTSTDDLVEGLRLGAHDYLRKPFEPAEVVARVRAAARVKRLQEDLRLRNAELDRISRSDALTGLANRRHIHEQLDVHVASARRHEHPLAVAIIDVDHFKSINDTHGHIVGDIVLREIAGRIDTATRVEDVVGRWGGEEFMAILPHCDEVAVAQAGDRIREAVAALPVDGQDGVAVAVTVSVGCASGADEDLVARADAALYEAKTSGRNRTVLAPAAVNRV